MIVDEASKNWSLWGPTWGNTDSAAYSGVVLSGISAQLSAEGDVLFMVDADGNSTVTKFEWRRDSWTYGAGTLMMDLNQAAQLTIGGVGAGSLVVGGAGGVKISEPVAGEWTVEAETGGDDLVLEAGSSADRVRVRQGDSTRASALVSVAAITNSATVPTSSDYPYGSLWMIYT
jgi:hypothetical protein